ncbi:MAG: hypothetical protein ABJA62_10040 [Luteimonas sp.]
MKTLTGKALTEEVASPLTRPTSVAMGIALCAFLTACLDLAFAIGWWSPRGVPPIHIFQSVASWMLGREAAITGGLATATFGFVLQCAVMALICATYFALARRHARLRQQPLRWGALYGGVVYVIQHLLIVPFYSAISPAPWLGMPWMLACLAVYVTLVGIPCALFARAFLRDR